MKPMITTLLTFQNLHENMPDHEFMTRELKIGLLAEETDFDALWLVEHHFDSYAMCPDNFQVHSWLAAKTKRIKLGIGAAILPWNDPLRVMEKAVVLDILSDGRVLLGFGRGLSRMEYRGFRQNMDESRERFDESAAMIRRGLATGTAENDGPFYPQPSIAVRPRPYLDYENRLFAVAMSPESLDGAADIGATMMSFVQNSDDQLLAPIQRYRDRFEARHGRSPGPVVLADVVFCHSDAAYAEKMARKYIAEYFFSLLKHYEFAGKHFEKLKGYNSYAAGAQAIREAGLEVAAQSYVNAQVWGTPAQMIERYRRRIETIGAFTANTCFSYGGLPFAECEQSMRLFAAEVMPTLRNMLEEASTPELAI